MQEPIIPCVVESGIIQPEVYEFLLLPNRNILGLFHDDPLNRSIARGLTCAALIGVVLVVVHIQKQSFEVYIDYLALGLVQILEVEVFEESGWGIMSPIEQH